MDVLFVLTALAGSWIGFHRWAKKKGLSGTIAHGGGFLVGVVAMVIAVLIVAPETNSSDKEPETKTVAEPVPPVPMKTPEQLAAEDRKKRVEKIFSPWDGSHRQLEQFIKKAMNDPDSYDHVETVFWDRGDHLVVRTTYRGKNGFGGVVKEWVKAKSDLDGNLIQIIEHSND